jgi:hypothetical protein
MLDVMAVGIRLLKREFFDIEEPSGYAEKRGPIG